MKYLEYMDQLKLVQIYAASDVIWYNHFGNCQYQTKFNICLLYDPTIPFPGIYPK